jgi:hypothetical protein
MVNRQRGEISATLEGRQWTLCLTLSAFACLETHFNVSDLPELAARLATGKFSSHDLVAILHAGLRGGGHDIDQDEVARMRCDKGSAGYAEIVAELLIASFGSADSASTEKVA